MLTFQAILKTIMLLGKQKQTGFTIVELLIVIVVIGILAALVLNSFAGAQGKAHDAQRLTDARNIVASLKTYWVQNGTYPPVSITGAGSEGGWESSANELPGQFIDSLKQYGFSSGVPVDPINTSIGGGYRYR
ncbi:MAG: type II secretion system protein, partial [Microcoleus sp.]